MRVAKVIEDPLDPFFEQLFETGVDEMSWDDMSKNEMDWPVVRRATEYRRQAYQIVKNVILTHPGFNVSNFILIYLIRLKPLILAAKNLLLGTDQLE